MEAKIPEKTDPYVAFFQLDSTFRLYIQKDNFNRQTGLGLNGIGDYGNGGIKCQPQHYRQKYFTEPQGKTGTHEDSIYPGSAASWKNSFTLS